MSVRLNTGDLYVGADRWGCWVVAFRQLSAELTREPSVAVSNLTYWLPTGVGRGGGLSDFNGVWKWFNSVIADLNR